jgi:hypothetical protein
MALTGAVGGINVRVNADASGFHTTMNSVGNRLRRTGALAQQSSRDFGKWKSFIAAAASSVAVVMIKSQMNVMDSLAKTSDALGVQQEQLQALQHVAELTGTGAKQLSVNLERMQRRIGEVARKGGQAGAALEEIGVSAKDMIALPADEQLVKISEAMGSVTNSSVKASISMDLFGRDGIRMLKMMEQLGKDGITPTVKKLGELGVILSRLDTAKVEQANDALFKTQEVAAGIVNKVGVKLSPLIQQLGEDFLSSAKDANGFGSTIDSVISKAITIIGVFADGVHGIKIIFKGIEVAARAMSVVIGEVFRVVSVGIDQLINVGISAINKLINATNEFGLTSGIKPIKSFTSSAAAMFTRLSTEAKDGVAGAIGEMHAMAMETIPSEQLDKWVAKANAMSEAAAKLATEGGAGGGSSTVGLTDDEKTAMAIKLEAIRASLLTETELKREALAADLLVLQNAQGTELESKTLHAEQIKALKAKTDGEITAIENKAKNDRIKVAESEKQAKLNALGGAFKSMSSLMNTESKKLFEIGKAAAVAGALVDAYAAVTGAYKVGAKMGGPLLGAAYAAAAGVAQAVNIQNISKQKMGGAQTMGATSSFSGGQAVNNTQQQSQNQNISLSGIDANSLISGGQLVSTLNAALGDGYTINFAGG